MHKDLSGQFFGYVKVVCEDYCDDNYRRYWVCKCICGKTCVIRGDTLVSSKNVNCGCKTSELLSQGHIKPDSTANISRILRSYKRRGKKSGLGFYLTRQEFESLIFDNCYYCGSPPSNCSKIKTKLGEQLLIYNGIDRLNNLLGYQLSNCVTCCIICNVAKSNMTLKEFFKWIVTVFYKMMWRVFHERELSV